jgi:predicted nucleic acid-binding protein
MIYILDANALIAWLRDETGADAVLQIIQDINNTCFAHAANLCEVYYDVMRVGGEQAADEAMIDLVSVNITERNDLDSAFWQEAAKLKAVHRRVSLADCFGVVLTRRLGGTLVTSDHHEMDVIAQAGICPIVFFR